MFMHRQRLRTPALLGIIALLVSGLSDISGVSLCLHHAGIHDAVPDTGPEFAGTASPSEGHGHDPHDDHGHAFGPTPGETAQAPGDSGDHLIHVHASSGDSSEEHGCDCRTLCLGLTSPAESPAPNPVAQALVLPNAPFTVLPDGEPGWLKPTRTPYFLPFSQAPPSAWS